jgi:signal transduction histidine kinase
MGKSQTVSQYIKSRLAKETIFILGLVVSAITIISIVYFFTRQSILLLAVAFLAGTCVINLIVFISLQPVLHDLKTLELWITDASQPGVVQPVINSPFPNKSIEPLFRACNTLASRLKGDSYRRVQFVDRLAHDLRSSMASIQGYAEVLVEYHIGIEGASLQSYGKIIASQTYRLVKMIDDARTAFLISEDLFSLKLEPLKLCTLLSAIIAEIRENNVREIILQDDLGDCMVAGDAFRLRDMMSKLVENALSFSTSFVSIQAQVENDPSGSWVKIKVEDHGKALSEPEIAALFHPFDLPKAKKTSPIFQSSLSFYIIKAIVDGHNGKLTVQSQPGQGTTYTVHIPAMKVNR